MSPPEGLLLASMACWCLALLRAVLVLVDGSTTRRDLLRAGVSATFNILWWRWIRVAACLLCALGTTFGTTMVPAPRWAAGSPWWLALSALAGALLGWVLPGLLLVWLARSRERQLGRAATALTEHLAVALLCGAQLQSAMGHALARCRDARLAPLLRELSAARPADEVRGAGRYFGALARHGARRVQPVAPALPPAVCALARVIRRASMPTADAAEVERLKRTLQSWSHDYSCGAYDWRVVPPEPRSSQLEDTSTIILNYI
jgi:hypothetical protein